ncbi:MAG: hypothetical protein AVDCRST_MAG02-2512, partial [uncultured Rubrobacteraceae bacterium]
WRRTTAVACPTMPPPRATDARPGARAPAATPSASSRTCSPGARPFLLPPSG